jgi:hypothetical protein
MQMYLYQAYDRRWRFYKIVQMLEKLFLVCITLYVPAAVLQAVSRCCVRSARRGVA